MRRILDLIRGRKARNTSSPKMLNNSLLHLSRDQKSRDAMLAASKQIKHKTRPDIKSQDLARLHKEK
jgi:hypothetical protein